MQPLEFFEGQLAAVIEVVSEVTQQHDPGRFATQKQRDTHFVARVESNGSRQPYRYHECCWRLSLSTGNDCPDYPVLPVAVIVGVSIGSLGMNDKAIAIILNARQVDRLQRQVTVLYDETFDYATLTRWRDAWESELAFLKVHPDLAEMAAGAYPASTLDSARTRVACYRSGTWSLLKEMGVDLSAYMDDFGAVDPDLKARFHQQYECQRRLSTQAQSDWLKRIALPWVDAWLAERVALHEGPAR